MGEWLRERHAHWTEGIPSALHGHADGWIVGGLLVLVECGRIGIVLWVDGRFEIGWRDSGPALALQS